jgi:hypothetical protein
MLLAAEAVEKINRYERRVLSRRRKALRALNNPPSKVIATCE